MRYLENVKPNINRSAKIGFICDYPFHYYLYKNIYKYCPDSEFILSNEIYPSNCYYNDKLTEMISFFNRQKVYWRVFNHQEQNPANFFAKYEILAGSRYSGCIARKYSKNKKKVRIIYGCGKALGNFGIGNCYFDLILTYGKYTQRYLSPYSRAKIVGNPRFDDWFCGTLDKRFINHLTKKLDPNKKTALYCPTHGNLSSIVKFGDGISKLTKYFNVIVKPHHITLWDEKEKIIKLLKNKKVITWSEEVDLLPLLYVCNVVISDNSGIIFDAVLADKSVVLLGRLRENFFKNQKSIKVRRKYLQPPLSYSEDIEQNIRKQGKEIGIVVEKPEDLKGAVIRSLDRLGAMVDRRRILREDLYAFNDGNCGLRAAEAIKDLLDKPKPKEKFLALAVKSYISNLTENLLVDHQKR